ncbi:SDR family NAD(P)-dependent oxidoreductase [Chitinophaga nivalis]|uniref:SDR family oxidoreductase n=1 Tax=Chitinophaga nivalis TaxID=2991709 RepID=A0ABT3IQB1_9BACT|nr:SDR family oxidoreductase [Chitinophaga nivalis]MCW3464138.1 SDR family oxidoreductase [Chitinophaga nivalis]MCW3486172.1 SDR family oxidoreductase [Chitinophaga nivalis]
METNSKIALITGGSRGLGKNMALHLAEKGHDVIITYNSNKAAADEVLAAIRERGQQGAAFRLDVADSHAHAAFFKEVAAWLTAERGVARFDFLINNAGTDARGSIAETSMEAFDGLMNIHFKGVFFLTQQALPYLADNGRIINLSSGLARFVIPGYAAYGAMKGAVEVFTRYLAKEVGVRGITANVVAPGIIRTDLTRDTFEHAPEVIQHITSNTALGRTGVPEDIGGIVTFLCSEEARWITAQRIEASGGMFL